ncbi:uncharacterized protein Gasu_26250 [Galdieria sulphuraria]|uniref:Uncharacterized protein n=1 Tax=Galdieria sulphuraria TaxID=130081 RepID=M2Y237_GALSU|nr:uncharacterized protein Gasu_26250 [Galdieria sulphuraria]EME30038.1 hypothetical protein Gasu_26250 [Galdieria sulphuraria]|eukprot:XP_005706558.1 hypothetical protein Gasu_26250 [Galdieria sulphuraria]
MSLNKQWLAQRKSLLEAFRKLSDARSSTQWQIISSHIEDQLKEEDNEKTLLIYKEVVRLCQSPQNSFIGLKLLDQWLPCSRLLREWILEPLEPCLIQLVESGSTKVCQFLSLWDEYYGVQFPSLHTYVRRFVKKKGGTMTSEPSCPSPATYVPCGWKEDALSVMKQLRECLALIVPRMEDYAVETATQGHQTWTTLQEPKDDITIQLVTDISLLETEENRIVFDSCREFLGQLEKIYSRAKQVDKLRDDWMCQIESLLQHCYQLGLRSQNNRSLYYSYDKTSEDEDTNDIVWETVDAEEVEDQVKLWEPDSCCAPHDDDKGKQQTDKQESMVCNEDILQQLESTMPYPKRKERKQLHSQSSCSHETSLREKPNRIRTKKETSKHRIAKQLKRSASKVSKTWNQLQEREDLERYHQTFANSVTVGRID